MVTLYRGITQKPILLTPEFEITASPRTIKFLEGVQDFCDDEATARGFAGNSGFLIKIDVNEEYARLHYRGDYEIILDKRKEHVLSRVKRFEIPGRELGKKLKEWNYLEEPVSGKLNKET